MENDVRDYSIVDCVYDVGEKVDLKEFLSTYRNPYPIIYIAETICNEVPEGSLKYKEIKNYIDKKLEMKRGCRYEAVIRIIWAAIRYAYPNMNWDELSLKFKKHEERPVVTLIRADSIEENIKRARIQIEAYFDTHESVPLNVKEYIRSNIDKWDTVEKLKYMLGNIFNVCIIRDLRRTDFYLTEDEVEESDKHNIL